MHRAGKQNCLDGWNLPLNPGVEGGPFQQVAQYIHPTLLEAGLKPIESYHACLEGLQGELADCQLVQKIGTVKICWNVQRPLFSHGKLFRCRKCIPTHPSG